MSESSKNIWYQLGYVLETARQGAPAPKKVHKKPGKATMRLRLPPWTSFWRPAAGPLHTG